jgi:hypothetical protein
MKFPEFSFINRLFGRKRTTAERQEHLLRTALSVTSYARLTIQEKIVLVARLIDRFQNDYGFVPADLEKTLLTLNRNLNKAIKASFIASRNIDN